MCNENNAATHHHHHHGIALFGKSDRDGRTARGINDPILQAAVAQGKRRSVLRHLLATHGKSERNAVFRRNLCLAAFATRLSLLVPVFALWSWGLVNIVTVSGT